MQKVASKLYQQTALWPFVTALCMFDNADGWVLCEHNSHDQKVVICHKAIAKGP